MYGNNNSWNVLTESFNLHIIPASSWNSFPQGYCYLLITGSLRGIPANETLGMVMLLFQIEIQLLKCIDSKLYCYGAR